MLSNILKKDYIKLNLECKDWEDAIRKSGNILLENKLVTNEYIEEAVKGVKELGPYIVIAKGVALPHTANDIGVKKNGIVLVTLKEPIEFGNKNNDPVNYIFMLATTDINSHLEALSNISDFLEKQDFLEVIKNAKDTQLIIDYIKANENESEYI